MTLIIAGHNFEKSISYSETSEMAHALGVSAPVWKHSKAELQRTGLFAVSDSAITHDTNRGKEVLIGGFQKIYGIPVKILEPQFLDEAFRGYGQPLVETKCFLAMAGSTLTMQHCLNKVRAHLEKLEFSIRYDESDRASYCIVRHCEDNLLKSMGTNAEWGEHLFVPADLLKVEIGDWIADAVEQSISFGLSSARRYRTAERFLPHMHTEFALGLYCTQTEQHRLFEFVMDFVPDEFGYLNVNLTRKEIPPGEIVVLGMKEKYGDLAQACFDEALAKQSAPCDSMFNFLNDAIAEERGTDLCSIAKPSVGKTFSRGRLEGIHFCDE